MKENRTKTKRMSHPSSSPASANVRTAVCARSGWTQLSTSPIRSGASLCGCVSSRPSLESRRVATKTSLDSWPLVTVPRSDSSLRWLAASSSTAKPLPPGRARWAATQMRLAGSTDAFLGSWESAEQFAAQMLEYLRPPTQMEQSAEEVRPDLHGDADELAHELQRRGDISVVANPEGGVWVFRRLQGEALPSSPQRLDGSAERR